MTSPSPGPEWRIKCHFGLHQPACWQPQIESPGPAWGQVGPASDHDAGGPDFGRLGQSHIFQPLAEEHF